MAIALSWLQQHSCLDGNTQEKTIKAHTFFRDLWLADFGALKYISDTARRTFFRFFETSLPMHCKYIRSNYDGITVYHRTSTIFRCNVPLHLNIPIAKIRYPKIYSDMIVKCQ